ncbi:hypothetical protein ANCCAN_09059 [Ancylostoma caninum]|uniref:Uncharacterized protein n=1 Tax=Ancylostoma caninum TaxID=29170 RepID=A0A368GPL5_ANCCA|nr:hypothetical protein ANCCAN_09059 [Ancylostoma caninum]
MKQTALSIKIYIGESLSEKMIPCTTREKVPVRKALVINLQASVTKKQDCVFHRNQLQLRNRSFVTFSVVSRCKNI